MATRKSKKFIIIVVWRPVTESEKQLCGDIDYIEDQERCLILNTDDWNLFKSRMDEIQQLFGRRRDAVPDGADEQSIKKQRL